MPRKLQSKTAASLIPPDASLDQLRSIAAGCKACDLWQHGTQTVFGEGPVGAEVMFVGEQPGDKEDLEGRPFVGPAGTLLDHVLGEVGIDHRTVYVTNIVKHFKWEPRGKRRIHKKPNSLEIAACRPWLEGEIERVHPRVVVLLGATAAQAILGNKFLVTHERGKILPGSIAPHVMATVHPSAILRALDDESRRRERQLFLEDLAVLAKFLRKEERRAA